MCRVSLIVLALTCVGGPPRPPRAEDVKLLDLSGFKVSDQIAGDYRLAHCPYREGGVLVAEEEKVQADLAEREREYSQRWVWRVLDTVRTDTRTWTKGLHLTSSIQGRDDGAFIAYWDRGYCIEVLDYRALTVLVRKDGLASVRVVDLLSGLVERPVLHNAQVVVTEEHVLAPSEAYGRLKVDRDGRQTWFTELVEWYRNGDAVLFLFTKELPLLASKGPLALSSAPIVIGGIPDDDPRPFLRFENSNRVQLAEEYFAKKLEREAAKGMQAEPVDPDAPPQLHNRSYGSKADDE